MAAVFGAAARLGWPMMATGKFADSIVIDRDFLACPDDEIRAIQVLRTVVGGKTVFQK